MWRAWTPREAADRLSDVAVPWYVAAGWAIDLFLGEQRREHEDLEIAVPADRFGEVVGALGDAEWFVPGSVDGAGMVWPLAGAGETLDEHHQTWARERSTGFWRIDVFREPSAGGQWVSRRHPDITLPYSELILHTEDGIPFARPEAVLLFKAKHLRPKDQGDLEAVLPHLDVAARGRLAAWLAMVHPGHKWSHELGERRGDGQHC